MDIKDNYTTKEAAQILGLSEYTVRKKIRDKELMISGKEGKSYLISKNEIARYLKKQGKMGLMENIGSVSEGAIGRTAIGSLLGSAIAATIPGAIIGGIIGGLTGNKVGSFEMRCDTLFNDVKLNKNDVNFYKDYYEGRQQDLKVAKLEYERLMLDKEDTVEFKKKKLDIEMKIETIKSDLHAIKMKIDSLT
ncbi:helix-turn-helix domain-containing protein [Megamonas hypermegale]|uniref:helix-turn-helix domain-containing protein n=1 Tax=Megamonas hypermegale TaxID=158847 RepID=UPI0026F14C56|nr:helix-turn-helix domain-containing protein [Megamonas hypermegale]